MITGILGKKIGMSQVFQEDGRVAPVTVVEAGPCIITQVKSPEKDGYTAVQVGFVEKKKTNKPTQGHLKGSGPFRFLREIPADDVDGVEVGQTVDTTLFEAGDMVDVTGLSKGRGFQGTVKRHGFHGGPKTHGQSDRLRAPGSVGGGTTPGRVYKGKPMSGHMGNRKITVRKLEVIRVDPASNIILIKGAVPGSPNGLILIRKIKGTSKES